MTWLKLALWVHLRSSMTKSIWPQKCQKCTKLPQKHTSLIWQMKRSENNWRLPETWLRVLRKKKWLILVFKNKNRHHLSISTLKKDLSTLSLKQLIPRRELAKEKWNKTFLYKMLQIQAIRRHYIEVRHPLALTKRGIQPFQAFLPTFHIHLEIRIRGKTELLTRTILKIHTTWT